MLNLISKKQLLWLVVLGFALGQSLKQNLQARPRQQPKPPEVQKTTNAILGKWSGQMTAKVGAAPPESFTWTMDCKSAAFGAGAACTNEGTASIGSMSESCLLAYDPEGNAVHYMCVTSMGEVHDHKGRWKDDKTIEFEPLRAGMIGKLVTETNRWFFPTPDTILKTSTVSMPDGTSMTFEFNGRRKMIARPARIRSP
jgi:hypothetical protein